MKAECECCGSIKPGKIRAFNMPVFIGPSKSDFADRLYIGFVCEECAHCVKCGRELNWIDDGEVKEVSGCHCFD